MADPTSGKDEAAAARAAAILARQRAAQDKHGVPDAPLRIDRLDRCVRLLAGHRDDLCRAMSQDFGVRSADASLLTDIVFSIAPLRHARAHVREWMKPRRRGVEMPLSLLGARAEIRFEPKGVVGVIAPWNFPVYLVFAPLAGVLAAGNRAMIKPSEMTPATSDLLEKLVRLNFDEEELAVVLGGRGLGEALSRLPFDHLMFTGAARTGSAVMAAAAENLTPVTLELGGKCPVIVGRDADLDIAAARIMAGKTLNAGQACLAPDYALVPRAQVSAFVAAAKQATTAMFPRLRDNPDYSAIIDRTNFERVQSLLTGAGGETIVINPLGETLEESRRKIAPTLIVDPPDDSAVLWEEIFGPLLPIKPYDRIEEAIAFVKARPTPLALYYFGEDGAETERVLSQARSGGVTINDVIFHIAQEDLPFGGLGASGMGRYHGYDGFLEFSHQRGVYRQIRSELIARLRPPYGARFREMMRERLK